MTPALTPSDRAKLETAGPIRYPKVTHIIAPKPNSTFKTTPGPRQGVEYKSPYRYGAGRAQP